MPLYSRCPQCGKSYAAGDDLAGQEVRCRKCGTTFALPQAGNASEGFPPPQTNIDLSAFESLPPPEGEGDASSTRSGAPAVEKFESDMKGGVGSAKSRLDAEGPVDEYEVGAGAAAYSGMENPLLDFPFAARIDRLLPRSIIALMLLLTAYIAWSWPQSPRSLDEIPPHNPGWAGLITAVWLLVLFVAVWLPLVFAAGKRGMMSVRLRIPYRRVQRMAAIASLPFAVSAIFWLQGSDLPAFIAGVVLGSIPAGGAAYFLLRPRPPQLVSVLTPLLVGVAASAVISAGLTAGASALLGTTLRTYKALDVFDGSPFGPGLPWAQAATSAPPPPVAPAPKRPALSGNITPPPPPVTQPALSPLVHSVLPLASAAGFEQAIVPQPMDEFLALQRHVKNDLVVELQSIVSGRAVASAVFAPEANATAALSSDGRFLARLSSFPRLSVQIWSFEQDRVVRSFELSSDSELTIVGFTPAGQVVVQSSRQKRQGSGGAALLDGLRIEFLDVATGARQTPVDLATTVAARLAYAPDYSSVAFISAEPTARLVIQSLLPAGTLSPADSSNAIDLQRVDPSLAVRPSAMTFSPEGSRIALAFERDRQLVLLIWKTSGKDLGIEHVYPRGLDLPPGEAIAPRRPMVWLAEPPVCIYGGTAVLDPVSGQYPGSLALANVREMAAAGPGRILLQVGAAEGPTSLLLVELADSLKK